MGVKASSAPPLGGEPLHVLVEQAFARHREHDDVLALDLGQRRQQVEVAGEPGAGLLADLLDFEAHQVAQLPVGHARHMRVAHVEIAARHADARRLEREGRFARRPARGLVGARDRRGVEVEHHEALLLLPAAQEARAARADVDAGGGLRHGFGEER